MEECNDRRATNGPYIEDNGDRHYSYIAICGIVDIATPPSRQDRQSRVGGLAVMSFGHFGHDAGIEVRK